MAVNNTVYPWFLSLLVMVCIPISGCQTTHEDITAQQQEINSMERVGNHGGLVRIYQGMLEQGNSSPQVLESLAWAYFNKGDIESADFYVQHLIESGSKGPTLYQLAGQVAEAQENTEQAITYYLAAISSGNSSGKVHLLLGVAYANMTRFEEAKAQFNTARLRGYDDKVVKNNIAMIHMAKGDYHAAVTTLSHVLENHPKDKTVRSNLAIALLKSDRIEAAKKLLSDDFDDLEFAEIVHDLAVIEG
jgi:tight adherence protein D